jgi:biopolymer transport protein ExbB/TolQ
MKWITQALSVLSNALLVPDLVAALLLVGLVLFEVGLLLAALASRRSEVAAFAPFRRDLRANEADTRRDALDRYLTLAEAPASLPFALAGAGASAWSLAVRRHVVEEAHLLSERRLARLTLAIRLGPVVGLVGTLIPLGPGLAALAQGDLAQLSAHLIVAFAVTVVGVATGALAYVLATVRRALDGQDLAALALVSDSLDESAPTAASGAAVDAS